MAIFDKIGEIAKIAANKTEEITKTIGEKAEAAMEIQKLTSLVSKEESKIESTYKKMGKMVWEKSQTCDCLPDEFKAECEAVKASLAAIEDLKFKISNAKTVEAEVVGEGAEHKTEAEAEVEVITPEAKPEEEEKPAEEPAKTEEAKPEEK